MKLQLNKNLIMENYQYTDPKTLDTNFSRGFNSTLGGLVGGSAGLGTAAGLVSSGAIAPSMGLVAAPLAGAATAGYLGHKYSPQIEKIVDRSTVDLLNNKKHIADKIGAVGAVGTGVLANQFIN